MMSKSKLHSFVFSSTLFASLFALSACSDSPGTGSTGGGGSGGSGTGGISSVVPDDMQGGGDPAVVEPNPTSPTDDAGGALTFSEAPLLEGLLVKQNRDSVVISLPEVEGARDYRIFAIPPGVTLETDAEGRESVKGGTLFCAGYRQHNAAAMPDRQLMRMVEVTGLSSETRLVVEALDEACPFPGVQGLSHGEVTVADIAKDGTTVDAFSVFTEQEIKSAYGSMIINGHGPGQPAGASAPPNAPHVLARTTIRVSPLGYGSPALAHHYDFSSADQPVFVEDLPGLDRSQNGKLYQTADLSLYTYGSDLSQMFIDRGRLHSVLADWRQEIFSSNIAYPRQAVALSDTDYLHVRFEVATNSTQRRYWWLSLCGAETAGNTIGADGKLLGNIIQTAFFYQDDGLNPSVEGWNCLQVFPRDGWPFDLPPSNTNPESDLRVMVNLPNMPVRESVVNVSPRMYPEGIAPRGWFRQIDANGNPIAPILDDQLLVAPATRYDVYIKRDRVILYANGEERLCNDFPTVALSMAEGALGFGQVLYHSSAERFEFTRDDWMRTGQRYYLENTPFVDTRAWDNLGYEEHVAPPPNFDGSRCYVYTP